MKAVVKDKKEPGLSFEYDAKKPVPGPHEVLIKLKSAAICGTDIHFYKWNQAAIDFMGGSKTFPWPYYLGHEGAGVVEAVGELVTKVKVGQRVTAETHISCGECFNCKNGEAHNCAHRGRFLGCFSEYTVVDENYAFILPEGISYEEGSLMEPAGVALRAVEEACIQPGDTVLVNGCGPIGLMLVQMLTRSLTARVIAVDMNEFRLKMAESFGAISINFLKEDVTSRVKEIASSREGVDVVFEMSGAPAAYKTVFDYLRREGRFVVVGNPSGEIPINFTKNVFTKGIKLRGVNGRRIWGTWLNLASLIESKKIDLMEIVTHKYPLEEYEKAFESAINGDSGKVLFTFDE